jgi:hypothetical protein
LTKYFNLEACVYVANYTCSKVVAKSKTWKRVTLSMERVWNYILTKVIVKPICNNHNELIFKNIATIGTFKILKLKKMWHINKT